ncbi:MAG TPA: hypothetical protein GXZ95_02475 [Mollicutes bacterium]|nr:hypothetical protein [Mollicutes bacterium]
MEFVYKDPIIYVIAGKARRGKTTSALLMKEEYEKRGKKVAITSYGKHIKDYVKNYFGWDGNEKTKPRELLQSIGTDLIRGKLKKYEFFVNRTIEDIEILSYFFDVIIIDDARLEIEIEKPRSIFDKIVAIKITRDNVNDGLTEKQRSDITEIDFDDYYNFDYFIHNNGTLDDLKDKFIKIIDEREMKSEKNE